MAVKQPPNFGEYKAHMVGLGLRTQTESGLEKNLVSSAKILQVDGCNGPIGNGHQRALVSADASGTQADVFDQSRAIAEATHISHAKHFIAQDRNSTEEIFDGLLRSEADGQSADTEAGERGAHVEAQVAEHSENAPHKNHGFEDSLAQEHERARTRMSARQGAIAHAMQGPLHDAPQNPGCADN